MIEIHALETRHINQCITILRELPQWFGMEEGIIQFGEELKMLDGFVATHQRIPVGFVSLKRFWTKCG